MGVEMHVAVTASHALLMALVTKTGWDSAYPYQRNDHVEGGNSGISRPLKDTKMTMRSGATMNAISSSIAVLKAIFLLRPWRSQHSSAT